MGEKSGRERALILVKALPRGGKVHGETVCCAGITPELEWRRQYPIRFRHLRDGKFQRWQWIEYDYRLPSDDSRKESRRVQEGSIEPGEVLSRPKRADLLKHIIVPSVDFAAERGDSLALIRPRNSRFSWRGKTPQEIDAERLEYIKAASQKSLFDDEKKPLDSCPWEFFFEYESSDGKPHKGICHDWETAAMFWRFQKSMGEKRALQEMDKVFNQEYPEKGMVFAMGTHSRWPDSWLLNGVIRLDEADQLSLL